MSDNRMNEIIESSLDGIKSLTDMQTAIGMPINTPSGVTVIPVSRVNLGFAVGGVDLAERKTHVPVNFGGGGGTGISITPLAFLTVGKSGEVNLIPLSQTSDSLDKIVSLVEKAPDSVEKLRGALS